MFIRSNFSQYSRGEGGLKYSPPLCSIPVKTNRFKYVSFIFRSYTEALISRIVVDSCLRPGRKGIYAIQVRGSKDPRAGVVVDPNGVSQVICKFDVAS
jgi:hypothetical protein